VLKRQGTATMRWNRLRTRKIRSSSRRRKPWAFFPNFEQLEERFLLSLSIEKMFNPPPGVEGASTGNVELATFTFDNAVLGDYTAEIEWGDGFADEGTVQGGNGSGTVLGEHTYDEEGAFSIHVTITGDGHTATGDAGIIVLGAPLTGTGASITPTESSPFTGVVASFTDADPNATAGEFTAIIDWGEGHISQGTVQAGTNGGFPPPGREHHDARG